MTYEHGKNSGLILSLIFLSLSLACLLTGHVLTTPQAAAATLFNMAIMGLNLYDGRRLQTVPAER